MKEILKFFEIFMIKQLSVIFFQGHPISSQTCMVPKGQVILQFYLVYQRNERITCSSLQSLTTKYEQLEASHQASQMEHSSSLVNLQRQITTYQEEVKEITQECDCLRSQNKDLIDSVNNREVRTKIRYSINISCPQKRKPGKSRNFLMIMC